MLASEEQKKADENVLRLVEEQKVCDLAFKISINKFPSTHHHHPPHTHHTHTHQKNAVCACDMMHTLIFTFRGKRRKH